MTSLVISSAPLSETYRNRLQKTVTEDLVFVHVADLRRQSPFRALRQLRHAALARCYIALEDEASQALLPLLQAIGSATWPRQLWLVREDLSSSLLSHARLPLALTATFTASAKGALAARSAAVELRRLGAESRIQAGAEHPARMLYLNANLWFGLKVGGSVGHVAGVVNAFAKQGLEVCLATAAEPVMIAPAVRVLRLPPPTSVALPFELNYYSFQSTVLKRLKGQSADICYQRLSLGNYAGVALSRRLRIPLIIEWNGSEVWIARNWGRPLRYEALACAAEEISLKHAHIIVTVSPALRDELVGRGLDPDRIVCHANGVDPTVFDPERFSPSASAALRETHGIPVESTVVTFVGTFGRWHGADVLARAIRQIIDKRPQWLDATSVRFLFVGDGPMLKSVKEILSPAAALPFVRFTGVVPQAEAPAYLAASDIVVSPHIPNADGSPFFGSPTKLFEYLAMGRAILASDLDQIGEVLRDGISVAQLPDTDLDPSTAATAIRLPPGDEQALVTGISYLVTHPASRRTIGRNARHLALSHYTWAHHVEAILERLDLIGSKR